jgi:hypothetical protein
MPASAAPNTVVAQLVEAMRALAGSHPGFRPAHAKGIVCSGAFSASPEARRASRALTCRAGRGRPSSGSPMPAAIRTCTTASRA